MREEKNFPPDLVFVPFLIWLKAFQVCNTSLLSYQNYLQLCVSSLTMAMRCMFLSCRCPCSHIKSKRIHPRALRFCQNRLRRTTTETLNACPRLGCQCTKGAMSFIRRLAARRQRKFPGHLKQGDLSFLPKVWANAVCLRFSFFRPVCEENKGAASPIINVFSTMAADI